MAAHAGSCWLQLQHFHDCFLRGLQHRAMHVSQASPQPAACTAHYNPACHLPAVNRAACLQKVGPRVQQRWCAELLCLPPDCAPAATFGLYQCRCAALLCFPRPAFEAAGRRLHQWWCGAWLCVPPLLCIQDHCWCTGAHMEPCVCRGTDGGAGGPRGAHLEAGTEGGRN